MSSSVSSPYPSRSALVLTWGSLLVCVAGVLPLLVFLIHASWGEGGEIGGMALIGGAIVTVGILTLCSVIGLVLGLLARRRGARTRASWLALTINALALGGVLVLVLVNVLPAVK